ncbi:cell adhesion molecule Dscam1-like [Brevipalpus obovatus]|uniref:cell adhesion molecule Dscam1-like n=1 Tax=Brevipalpus obovatus TaxID=246614 RepID=UPI003D9F0CEF
MVRNIGRSKFLFYLCAYSVPYLANYLFGIEFINCLAHDRGPLFLEFFTDQQMKQGDSLSLKCMATGDPLPQITWKLDGFPFDNNRNVRTGDYVTNDNYVISFVNISSVTAENGGTYSCSASSEVNTIENSAPIIIIGRPFVRPMTNLTMVAGNQLVVKCPVGGHPISSIYWEKGSKLLPSNHRQTVHPNGTLIIRDIAKESDEGYYACTAVNGEGLESSNGFHLSIKVVPKIDPFSIPFGIQVGQRLTIVCTVIKGDSPFSIIWLKNGTPIESDDHHKDSLSIHHLADYSSTLLFKAIKAEHEGNYTCMAKNSVGQDSHTQMMSVHAPPQWLEEPLVKSATKGQHLWINCQATGSPQPSIVWKKFQNSTMSYKTLVSSFHIQTLDNGTLFINDIQPTDVGLYLCQASNGVGMELSKVIYVSVHDGAHFRSRFQSLVSTKMEEVRLSCEATGENPISINWKKNNKPIIFDPKRTILDEKMTTNGFISQLHIMAVERSDSALYVCQAVNGYGKDEHTIQLIVKETPDPPIDIRVMEVKSRSMKLTWNHPFNGNSGITKYHIFLREHNELISMYGMQMRNFTVPASEKSWIIKDLVPYTNYSICLTAVNEIGESDSSHVMRIQTDEEVPNEPPKHIKAYAISSKTIKVTWDAPETRYPFGLIRGYYVGYRPHNIERGSYLYKTLFLDDVEFNSLSSKPETILTDLGRKTKYQVVVQAFNSKGSGVLSEPLLVETFYEDPPRPPKIHSTSSSHSSISLEWFMEPGDEQISGFILRAKSVKSDIIEKRISHLLRNFTLQGLLCGTHYEMTLAAYNNAGNSEPSEILHVRTTGSMPIYPPRETFLRFINATCIEIDLTAWKSGGCPIKYFSIKYKMKSEEMWTEVSNKIAPTKTTMWIDGLHPLTFYLLKSTAFSDAGSTDAEFTLQTTSFADQGLRHLAPMTNKREDYQVFLEMEIVLPLLVSLTVVIAVIVLVCIMMNKRVPEQSFYAASSDLSKPSHANKMTNHMKLDKSDPTRAKLIIDQDQSPINYPSPYASVQVNEACNNSHILFTSMGTLKSSITLDPQQKQRLLEETPYATVKRTPRHVKSRCERNIYDYPVPITMNAAQAAQVSAQFNE